MAANKICGVSILRAGETMEQAFSDVCKDIRIGKILIQTNLHTGEPEVVTKYFGKLSETYHNFSSYSTYVFLKISKTTR